MRCLAPNPADRFGSALDVIAALQPSTARKMSSRLSIAAAVVAGVAFVALLCSLAFFAGASHKGAPRGSSHAAASRA
jgi:hypothetical protein